MKLNAFFRHRWKVKNIKRKKGGRKIDDKIIYVKYMGIKFEITKVF